MVCKTTSGTEQNRRGASSCDSMHSMNRHFASEKKEKQQASSGLSISTQPSEENHPYALKRLEWAGISTK